MGKTFLITFHGEAVDGKILDKGDDPCFGNPPTWGICRPNTRRTIIEGDTLIFIAKVNSSYFLKGWFQVGEKIDYETAMRRFPDRRNVIISKKITTRPMKWRYGNLKKKFFETGPDKIPSFLLKIDCKEGIFYQNPDDDHEIDNWKCRRIFHCQGRQFNKCIVKDTCNKNGVALSEYKNYIVADPVNWEDLDRLKITLEDIRIATGFNKPIRTPMNQHNVLRFDGYKEKLFNYLEERKKGNC